MSIQEYRVKQNMSHNGVVFQPGDHVGLVEKNAKVLIELGVVEPTGKAIPQDSDESMESLSPSDAAPDSEAT